MITYTKIIMNTSFIPKTFLTALKKSYYPLALEAVLNIYFVLDLIFYLLTSKYQGDIFNVSMYVVVEPYVLFTKF